MKPIPECVPDALNMIIATARAVSDDDFIHRKVLLKVMGELADEGDLGSNPADLYLQCWEIACRALGVKDPYEKEKARGDKIALGVLKLLEGKFTQLEKDALRFAIRTSFVGAMLDFTGLGRSEMQEKIAEYFRVSPALDMMDDLAAALDKANSVMLVANRAGEIVMDKPLAEKLADMGKKVWLAVAAKPVFSLATEKDAANAGFSDRISVISPGTAMYGLVEDRASSEFQALFDQADVVVVKGDTHFGTLTPQRDLFFILKAMYGEDARRLGVKQGDGAVVRISAE